MLRGIEKNLVLILVVVGCLTALSLLDSLGVLKALHLQMDNLVDSIIAILAAAAVIITIPLFFSVLKSRRLLQKWERLFEENSLRSSFELCLTGASADHAVRALGECVEEVGEDLQEYISAAGISNLLDNEATRDYAFDAVIDQESVGQQGQKLRDEISSYGSIIIKTASSGDEKSVDSFLASLARYSADTGHRIGLAIFIADDIGNNAQTFAGKKSMGDAIILLIEKPSVSPVH
jgi:hypothetical protein